MYSFIFLTLLWVGVSCSGNTLRRPVHTFLSPVTDSSSSWGILRYSQANCELKSLWQVLGLPQRLVQWDVLGKDLAGAN